MEIENKVVIVTGASQGIGRATAKLLAGLGAKVVLAARSEDEINKLSAELYESRAIVTDMRKPEDIAKLVRDTVETFGRVDILINNAGQGMIGGLDTMSVDEYKEIMDLNVFSVVRAMQEVIPHMRRQGSGMIVNISSGVTKMHIPGLSAYSSTKYALNALTYISRKELEEFGIKVCAVLPGLTATNFMQNSLGHKEAWSTRQLPAGDAPELVAQRIADAIQSEDAETEV